MLNLLVELMLLDQRIVAVIKHLENWTNPIETYYYS